MKSDWWPLESNTTSVIEFLGYLFFNLELTLIIINQLINVRILVSKNFKHELHVSFDLLYSASLPGLLVKFHAKQKFGKCSRYNFEVLRGYSIR